MLLSAENTAGVTETGPIDHSYLPEGLYDYNFPTVATGSNALIAISGSNKRSEHVRDCR
jgi:hypothetical protein